MKANKIIAKALRVCDEFDKAQMGKAKKDNLPLLILSSPGFGKTSTVRAYCEVMDYNLFTIIPSQSAADDILGIQSVQDGKLKRLTPSWFNKMMDMINSNGKRTLLFIDEISTCDAYIQGPLLDLIFSHNLGEAKLPENVFIVAAGNYSRDLNNEFKMSAPLVNRFMLLNLNVGDFDIKEIVSDKFRSIKSAKEMAKYLDVNSDAKEKLVFDFSKFKDWIGKSREILFGSTSTYDDESIGLLGFTSARSLTYCLNFAEIYMGTYGDSDWVRIVGDTLGMSNKRKEIPMRTVIKNNLDNFKKADPVEDLDLSVAEMCKKIMDNGSVATDEEVMKLENLIKNINPKDITSEDVVNMSRLTANVFEDQRYTNIINIFSNKMHSSEASY